MCWSRPAIALPVTEWEAEEEEEDEDKDEKEDAEDEDDEDKDERKGFPPPSCPCLARPVPLVEEIEVEVECSQSEQQTANAVRREDGLLHVGGEKKREREKRETERVKKRDTCINCKGDECNNRRKNKRGGRGVSVLDSSSSSQFS